MKDRILVYILVFFFVVMVWAGYWVYVNEAIDNNEARGQFGDKFGAVASLFSGLASAGMIVALIMQSKELALQREELKLSRAEAKASRLELERSAEAQSKTQLTLDEQLTACRIENDRKACLDGINMMTSITNDLAEIVALRNNSTNYENFNPSRMQISRACSVLSQLSFMDSRGLLPPYFVRDYCGDAIDMVFMFMNREMNKIPKDIYQYYYSGVKALYDRVFPPRENTE